MGPAVFRIPHLPFKMQLSSLLYLICLCICTFSFHYSHVGIISVMHYFCFSIQDCFYSFSPFICPKYFQNCLGYNFFGLMCLHPTSHVIWLDLLGEGFCNDDTRARWVSPFTMLELQGLVFYLPSDTLDLQFFWKWRFDFRFPPLSF